MLLEENDPQPVMVINKNSNHPFILVCDHAGNAIPKKLNQLTLCSEDIQRHIALDIVIKGVAMGLASNLQACLIVQNYSRLVIDCNRNLSHPNLIAKQSDETIIEGNLNLLAEEKQQRIDEIYTPYHSVISTILKRRQQLGMTTILISLHSFTPQLIKGLPRPWHLGILYAQNNQFALIVKKILHDHYHDLIGDNEPYLLNEENNYTIPFHTNTYQLPYLELEIRQDLIKTTIQQQEWSQRLKIILMQAYEEYKQL